MGLHVLDRLEQGLARPASAPALSSSSSSSSSLTSSRRWLLVFYVPSVAFPGGSRLLVLFRDGKEMGLASVLKGTAFGCIQDAAVFLQTLMLLRMALALRGVLLSDNSSTLRHGLTQILMTVLVSLAFLWMTFACLVDLTLLLGFLPRLNRGFVTMYLQFSDQFASSIREELTLRRVAGILVYLAILALWVRAVLCEKVQLPCFSLLFCQATTPQTAPPPPPPLPLKKGGPRSSVSTASTGSVFLWLMHLMATSLTVRTAFLALLVGVSALHATIALDGDGNDIYLMSNAMFSLEVEEFLRPPPRSHATSKINHSLSRASSVSSAAALSVHKVSANSTLADGSSDTHHTVANATVANATVANAAVANATKHDTTQEDKEEEPETPVEQTMNPFYERTIGLNEVFEVDEAVPGNSDAYPFWRKTVKYTGEKRFQLKPSNDASRPPPNVLVINLESFRSREVGVLGGRATKAQFNQTVTPFFDALSTTGVLFRQHYTPCVQTSRTILSSMFGILPSMQDTAAIATFQKTNLRLHGLPQILKTALNYATTFWSAVSLEWEDWRIFLEANGFDLLVDEDSVLDYLTPEQKAALTEKDKFSWGRHDAVSFDALENYLQSHRDDTAPDKKPLFMDVYTVSSHDPWSVADDYTPTNDYSAYVTEDNARYLTALNYVDQSLGRFIQNLRRKGLLNNTLVFIEGDHGFGRMEHGNNPNVVASYVYEEASHIPFLLLADDLLREQDKGLVVEELTSQTDLLATITDLVGATNFMQHGIGQSIQRMPRPGASERAVVLENPFYGQTRGLRVGRDLKYALYGSGKYEVFNLTSDPWEMTPVEKGKLAKDGEGGVVIGNDVSSETAEQLRFMEQVVDVAQAMYETNGFMPPAETSGADTPEPPPQEISEAMAAPEAESPQAESAEKTEEAETVDTSASEPTTTAAPDVNEVVDAVNEDSGSSAVETQGSADSS